MRELRLLLLLLLGWSLSRRSLSANVSAINPTLISLLLLLFLLSSTTGKTPHGPTIEVVVCYETVVSTLNQLSCNLPSALRVNQDAFSPCNPASRTSNSRSRITLDLFRVAPAACHSSSVLAALPVSLLVLRALHVFVSENFNVVLLTWRAKMPGAAGRLECFIVPFFFFLFLPPVSVCQLPSSLLDVSIL